MTGPPGTPPLKKGRDVKGIEEIEKEYGQATIDLMSGVQNVVDILSRGPSGIKPVVEMEHKRGGTAVEIQIGAKPEIFPKIVGKGGATVRALKSIAIMASRVAVKDIWVNIYKLGDEHVRVFDRDFAGIDEGFSERDLFEFTMQSLIESCTIGHKFHGSRDTAMKNVYAYSLVFPQDSPQDVRESCEEGLKKIGSVIGRMLRRKIEIEFK